MSEISKIDQILVVKKIDKTSTNLQISNNSMLQSIVGEFNQNLKDLEKFTNTTIFFRGNSLTVKGKNVDIESVAEAIKFLINKFLLALPLIITYLIGPIGLVIYWILRIFYAKRMSLYE